MFRTTTMTGLLLAGFLALCDGRPASGLDKKPDDAPKEGKIEFNPAAVDWETIRYAEARDRIRRERFSLLLEEDWIVVLEKGVKLKNVGAADLERAKADLKGERERVDVLWKEWEVMTRNAPREYLPNYLSRGDSIGVGGFGGGGPGGGRGAVKPAPPKGAGVELSPDVEAWLKSGFGVAIGRLESAKDALKLQDRWIARLEAGIASKSVDATELEREKKERLRKAVRVPSLEKELTEVETRMKLCGMAIPIPSDSEVRQMISSAPRYGVDIQHLDSLQSSRGNSSAAKAKTSARSERAQTNLVRLLERQKTGTATGLEVDRAMFEVTSAALLDELDGLLARHARSLAALEKAEGSAEQVKDLRATILRLEARRDAVEKASKE